MAICVKCGRRKAKRACPALGSSICALCCGSLREKEIRCAPSCRHLREHRTYQARRALEKTGAPAPPPAERRDPRSDERLGWLGFNVRAVLAARARTQPGFTDQDAVLALTEARERTVKPPPVLIVPGLAEQRTSAAAAGILKVLDTLRFESAGVLAATDRGYGRDEKLLVLDALLAEIRRTAGPDLGGRIYLSDLTAKVEQVQASAGRRGRIITP